MSINETCFIKSVETAKYGVTAIASFIIYLRNREHYERMSSHTKNDLESN